MTVEAVFVKPDQASQWFFAGSGKPGVINVWPPSPKLPFTAKILSDDREGNSKKRNSSKKSFHSFLLFQSALTRGSASKAA
jgi:hypothetical protein